MEPDPPNRAAVMPIVGAAAIAILALPAAVAADEVASEPWTAPDAPAPELPAAPTALPVFLRDTVVTMRLRTYYVDAQPARGADREAWALGGWLSYRSGWLLDTLQVGATGYGSAPVYDPADKADTLLLAPGGEGYYVLGEAFGAIRVQEYALLKGWRQLVDQPYVNAQDNAMTPNTFEGVTLGGTLGPVRYVAGYLARMKTRNADAFIPMSEAAGASGSDGGVALLGVRVAAAAGLELEVAEQYGVDTFNTLFARAEQTWRIGGDVRLELGAQLTDQRTVGAALIAPKGVPEWATRNVSGRFALGFRELTLKAGASVTAAGNRIQSPWGFYPGYLRLIQQLFNNAHEQAWVGGVAYDFSKRIARGLTASFDLARGVGSIDPATHAHLPDETEYDLSVIYLPPWTQLFRVRVMGVRLEQEGADRTGYQVRITVNWELPIVRVSAPGAGSSAEAPRAAPAR